jgi:hypothetical protein
MLAGAHGVGGGGDAMAHGLVAAHALRPGGWLAGSASAKGLCGGADPGLGDARHAGPNPAQARLTGACRGEPIGGGRERKRRQHEGERILDCRLIAAKSPGELRKKNADANDDGEDEDFDA